MDAKALDLRDAVRLNPTGDASHRLLIGRFAPPPSGGVDEPTPQLVALGPDSVQAYAYRNVPLEGERVDLFDIVHEDGDAVVRVACVRPSGDGAAAQSCARIAGSAQPTEIEPVRLTPSREYADALDAALGTLATRRTDALRQLRAADTPRGQAAAAAEVRDAYEAARRAVDRAAAPSIASAAHRELVGALGAAEDAYDRLAKGARAENESSYKRGRTAAVAAGKQLDRAMEQLDALGYTVR